MTNCSDKQIKLVNLGTIVDTKNDQLLAFHRNNHTKMDWPIHEISEKVMQDSSNMTTLEDICMLLLYEIIFFFDFHVHSGIKAIFDKGQYFTETNISRHDSWCK